MTAIRCYLDYARILQPAYDHVLAESVCDYLPTYVQMTEALHAGRSLTLIVRDRTCAAWLQVAQEKYGPEHIQIVTITHRSRLAELWNVEIPDWITDAAIERSGLLEIPLRAQSGQRFEDIILEAFYSPFLVYDHLPLVHIAGLLNSFDAERWESARRRPLVQEVLVRRLQVWAGAARSPGEHVLLEGLRSDAAGLARRLSQVKVLAHYPQQVGQRVLGTEYNLLAALNLNLDALPVREADMPEAVDQVRVHLSTLAHALPSNEVLPTMLGQVSGYLAAELDAVQSVLKSGSVTVSPDLVQLVRGKFAPIRDWLEQELADLDLLVTPLRPPDPDSGTWTADEWLDWAAQYYLPYRFWLEEIGQYDAAIAAQADAYAEWLYTSYPALRLTSPRMVYQGLLALEERMASSIPALVVVVDNLNAKFMPQLIHYLQTQGFFAESLSFCLAMLPSCTEVSKKCLFIGQPEPFPGTSYEKPILSAWKSSLGERRVCYLPHIGALRSVKQRKHDVYFLNYLPVDEILHKDEQQTGVPYSVAIRQSLRGLAEDIRKFAERIGAERDLVVIVTSDHGSTCFSADAPNPIDRKFYASRATDKHHRYVSISDRQLADLPENVRFQCYIFERRRFGLPKNYLAARSTYRFAEPGEGIYIHGGLSPEETIIPLAVFTPVVATPKPLSIRLLVDEFRYGKSVIRLELTNANAYPCQHVSVEVLNPTIEADLATLDELAALNQAEVRITARIRQAAEETTILHVRVTYQFLGRPQSQEVELSIEIKRMMTTAVDLGDLLRT